MHCQTHYVRRTNVRIRVASDTFSTIKTEAISLLDFKCTILSLNDGLIKSIWLENKGETVSANLSENFLLQSHYPNEKHLIKNLFPKFNMSSPLISFLQRINKLARKYVHYGKNYSYAKLLLRIA